MSSRPSYSNWCEDDGLGIEYAVGLGERLEYGFLELELDLSSDGGMLYGAGAGAYNGEGGREESAGGIGVRTDGWGRQTTRVTHQNPLMNGTRRQRRESLAGLVVLPIPA